MKKIELNIDKDKLLDPVQDFGEKAQDVAEQAIDKVKEGAKFLENQYDVAKFEFDRKRFRPVFELNRHLDKNKMPTLIRIVKDDKVQDNPAVKGAQGYEKKIKRMEVLNIFHEYAELSGINFYPCIKENIYCINPYNSSMYICLDEYFDYLKKSKIDELETIAHKLGAKHMRVTFKSQKEVLVSQNIDADAAFNKKRKAKSGGNADLFKTQGEYVSIEVASELDFDGNDTPTRPELVYFKNESDILALVDMRLDSASNNKIKAKTYMLKRSNKRELQEKTALAIDLVLKQLDCAGNISVVSKVQSDQRTALEYHIVFRD